MTNAKPKLVARLNSAYEKVSTWPEQRMDENAVEYLGEGFTDLLALRNMVPEAATIISQLTAERDGLKKQLDALTYSKDETIRQQSEQIRAAEKRAKELEEGRDLDKVVLDEGIEIINELESSNKLLSERVAVLEGAIEPFAAQAERYDPVEGDDDHPLWGAHQLTVGHVRRARSALEGK